MRLKLINLPENVISHYNFEEKVTTNVWVYLEIKRVMYGLPHAGLIAQQLLKNDSKIRATNKVKYTGFLDAQMAPYQLLYLC